jgi:serine/threonine-protein kinase
MAHEASGIQAGGTWGHLTLRRDLGPGARGLVYRAWDPELGAEVVLAIGPDVQTDPAGRDTLREARLLAKLRHPNLALVHGAERRHGRVGVWLELVDGETLETALGHAGRFSAREAALIGIDICAALSAMHEMGVLHRDLTTRQVIRDRNGRVVVVPFGAGRDALGAAVASLSLPLDEPLAPGAEPELVAGGRPRVETDVYRIGALLHRLVTGATAVGGPRRSLVDVRSDLPLGFVRTVERALATDPAERYPTVHDLAVALTTLWTPASIESAPEARGRRPARVMAGAVLAAGVVAIGVALGIWLTGPPPRPEVRFDVPPVGEEVESVAFSSDGQRLAYTSGGRLRLRNLNDEAAAPLEPALGARNPFFSADGQWVYFFGGITLWRVRVSGGEPQFVAPARRPSTGAAGPDGTVVYSVENGSSLMLLPPGGLPRVLRTQVPGERTMLRWPSLVGADHLLYSAVSADTGRPALRLGRLADPPETADDIVMDLGSRAVAMGRHVFYVSDGALVARRLDLPLRRLIGEPRVLARGIQTDPYSDGEIEIAVASTGAVAYVGGLSTARTLRIVDGAGATLIDLASGDVRDLRVSPDGTRVAYEQVDEKTGGRDIWVLDVRGGTPRRLTRHPGHDIAPTWSPDGETIFFLAHRGAQRLLASVRANGDGGETAVLAFDRPALPAEITKDGRSLLYEQQSQDTGWDVWIRPLDGGAPARLVGGPANEQNPALSPDGRWLAYSSPESEGRQVYLSRVSGPARRWRVSEQHGRQPLWNAEGTALHYHGHERQLIRVAIDTRGETPVLGRPQVLFTIPMRGYDMRYHYGVLPGPSRFVVNVAPPLTPPVPATVILNASLP